jgi:hypothetical protein
MVTAALTISLATLGFGGEEVTFCVLAAGIDPAAGTAVFEVPDVQPGTYTVVVSNDDPITTYGKQIKLLPSPKD